MSDDRRHPGTPWETWKERATAELQGGDFVAKLVTRTLEGIPLAPVYETPAIADLPAGDPRRLVSLPGVAPHTRGAGPHGPASGPTRICPAIEGGSLEDTERQVRAALGGGVGALWFHRIAFVDLGDLDRAFDALDPATVEILVRPTLPAHAVSAFWIAWLLRRHPAPADVRVHFGLDPLGRLARTGLFDLERSERDTIALARRIHEQFPRSTALAVSTASYQKAGASAVEELAAALATGVAYLRWLTGAGFHLDDAAGQIFFRFPLAADQFLEIAKLRAFRFCWARVLEAAGHAEAAGPRIHTVDSHRMLTVYDPWVNLLRSTLATFAAMVGGSDLHTPLPWDTRLGGADPLAQRIARNTGTILLEESHLGAVVDPAGGSTYVEALTAELAEAAWALFQELDREGMEAELLSGRFRARIAATWAARDAEIRRRRRAITGVSEFANLGEARPKPDSLRLEEAARRYEVRRREARSARAGHRVTLPPGPEQTLEEAIVLAGEDVTVEEIVEAWPLGRAGEIEAFPIRHDADPFETLRARAEDAGASVFLACLGPLTRHGARAAYARAAFATGGIRARDAAGTGELPPEEAAQAIARQFRQSGAPVACLCGADEDYATHGPAAVAALRSAGAVRVLRAGSPKPPLAPDAAIDDWIYLGSDLPAALAGILARELPEAQP